jgi:hypothetical protein
VDVDDESEMSGSRGVKHPLVTILLMVCAVVLLAVGVRGSIVDAANCSPGDGGNGCADTPLGVIAAYAVAGLLAVLAIAVAAYRRR